ncbi:sensor histidine kinase [Salinibacter grassmerensis]|uniref:sensor histidine kinase n=1 Tax=Salinibacter grassmerensis TaxID=3040353 RepID=UPI0021E99CDA|nr:HAMP domain-containing sensor histidine kinase [Salinibacter grassmerensis]
MSRIWKSLYGRISLLYLGLSLALCLTCAWVTVWQFRTFMGAVNQRLDRQLATDLVPRIEAAGADGTYDRAVKQVGATIEELRPAVQLYVLDASGRVRASSVEDPYLRRQRIDLAPIKAFVGGATVPVRAQDPASTTDRKVFSAAPIEGPDGQQDYLYVILNGCSADAIASTFKQTYVWRTFASSLLLALGFTTVVGLALFWLLTRRFRSLTNVVQRFKEGDYDERADAQRDDEIGQLGQAFNEMADTIAAQVEALRRTDEERRRLVAQVSHDFRTPLTSIRGHAERLLDSPAAGDGAPSDQLPEGENPPAPPQRLERIETILENTERLDRLSGRLHELSRLDAPESNLNQAPFSLAELAHDLVVKFRPVAEDRGLTLRVDLTPDLPSVEGDIGQIERLLSNLIENALENTPAGGEVVLRLQRDDDDVRVAVTDTGVGIPEEEIPLVTQRFHQVDQVDAPAGSQDDGDGSGLGLTVAANVAEAHSRSLEIDSTRREGTTVSLRLPVAT